MARLEGVLARAPGPALDKAHATAPGDEFEPHNSKKAMHTMMDGDGLGSKKTTTAESIPMCGPRTAQDRPPRGLVPAALWL